MDEKFVDTVATAEHLSEDKFHQHGVTDEQRVLYREFQGHDAEWHRLERKKLLRKVDWHMLPFLGAIYFLSYLDKNNLSQAKLAGLEEDLGMTGTDFNTATSIYFVGYILMQIPSNLALTRLRPSYYLAATAGIWGVISAAQAATQTYPGLVVARLFLGFAEAPVFPGCLFLMSSWYTRRELAHRFAWFYAGAQLANAFGGLIAAGVLANINGNLGIAGWRWLFIIDGCITIVISMIAALMLPNYPSTTRWLTPQQRLYAQWRLLDDTGDADDSKSNSPWEGLKLALKDPRVYIFVFLQHCSNLSQTFMYFFPSIVSTLGYGAIPTLLITAPVWFATFLVSLLVTYTSGRVGERSMHITCLMALALLGNIMVTATTNTAARFVAMFLMPIGANSAFQLIVTWVANSFPRPFVKRSAAVAIASAVANSATIYGSYIYPNSASPRYIAGGSTTAAVSLLVICLALAIRVWHMKLNKSLAEKEIVVEREEGGTEVRNLHKDDPDAKAVGFRFIL